jgi:hypothetical protein
MVGAGGCIAGQHFSWSNFIKQAELVENVSLHQPINYHKHHHHEQK